MKVKVSYIKLFNTCDSRMHRSAARNAVDLND